MKRHTWKGKLFRRAYRFTCTLCGKIRLTFSNERKDSGICATCDRGAPNPDQGTLPL